MYRINNAYDNVFRHYLFRQDGVKTSRENDKMRFDKIHNYHLTLLIALLISSSPRSNSKGAHQRHQQHDSETRQVLLEAPTAKDACLFSSYRLGHSIHDNLVEFRVSGHCIDRLTLAG